MLVIRLQRTGRSRHAMFRIVVQDSRRSPSSGNVVAHLGSYDPHTKTVNIDKELATRYLNNGAQPSNRAIKILTAQSVKLPKWVTLSPAKKKDTKNPAKRRSTAPKDSSTDKPEIAQEVANEPSQETEADNAVNDNTDQPIETAKPQEQADEKATKDSELAASVDQASDKN